MYLTLASLLVSMLLCISVHAQVNFPDVPDFTKIVQDKYYTPDDLWDLINGGADSYLEYEFRRLDICEYQTTSGETVKVEVYQHKSINCTFGIYAKERYSDYSFMDIGTEGYQTGESLNFFKGRYYVKCQGSNSATVKQIADEMDRALQDDVGFPTVLALMPDGNIEHSQQFTKRNFLGYSVLMDFFTAQYGEGVIFFISKKPVSSDASAVLKYLYEKSGSSRLEYTNDVYKIKDPHGGTIYIQLHDNYLFGTLNAKGKQAKQLLKACETKISEQ